MKPLNKSSQSESAKAAAANELAAASMDLTALPDEVWIWLLKDAERFARRKIARYRWRGGKGGVLPGGFDAESLASEAVMELLKRNQVESERKTAALQASLSDAAPGAGSPSPPENALCEPRRSRREKAHSSLVERDQSLLTSAATIHRAPKVNYPKGWETECQILRVDLHQRVRRLVNSLWHLMERAMIRNLEAMAPVVIEEGELISYVEAVPGPYPTPQESLIEREELANRRQFLKEFRHFLGNDGALQTLYDCMAAGSYKREDIAKELKVSINEVKNRLRRLKRRAEAFMRVNSCEGIVKEARNLAVQITHLQQLAKAA